MTTATVTTTTTAANTAPLVEDVVKRGIKRELPCKLADEEFTRIAKQRATKEAERDELEGDLAKETRKRKDQIKELDDEIGKMGRELRTGYQDRTVTCQDVFRRAEDGTGWIHTIRLDTHDEVERRPATAHETQRYLPTIEGSFGTGILADAAAKQVAAAERSAAPGPDESDVPSDDAGDDVTEEGDAEQDGEGETTDGKPASKRGGRKGK